MPASRHVQPIAAATTSAGSVGATLVVALIAAGDEIPEQHRALYQSGQGHATLSRATTRVAPTNVVAVVDTFNSFRLVDAIDWDGRRHAITSCR